MSEDIRPLYFRMRPYGAAVFRVDPENRHNRLELYEIAALDVGSGEISVKEGEALSPAERSEIELWGVERKNTLSERAVHDAQRLIESLNLCADWARYSAPPEALDALCEPLFLAMHDLRNVLVKKMADQLLEADD